MLKGCVRRVVYMKDTEGDLFEEAYFFVRNSPERKCNDRDMVREAERIITESSVDAGKKNKKRGLFSFLCGVLSSSVFFCVLFLILYLCK